MATITASVAIANDPITVDGQAGREYQAYCLACSWSGLTYNTIEDADAFESAAGEAEDHADEH